MLCSVHISLEDYLYLAGETDSKEAHAFTLQVSLWCSRLPRLHKDGQGDHIPNHNGEGQADHERHAQEAVEKPAAAAGAERSQRLARSGLNGCRQVQQSVGRLQQSGGAPADGGVRRQRSHAPGSAFKGGRRGEQAGDHVLEVKVAHSEREEMSELML